MAGLFSTPKLPPVAPPEPKPEITPEEQTALNDKLRRQRMTTKGRRATLLTGGRGIQDEPLVKRSTLGGY